MNRIIVVVVALVVGSGCATSTVIRTDPGGAVVRNARGEKVGKTPFAYSSSGIIGSSETFILEKAGYGEEVVTVKRDQVNGLAMAGWIIGGLVIGGATFGVGLPFTAGALWAADFQPVYTIELEKLPEAEPAPEPAAAEPTPSVESPRKRTRTASRE